MARSTGRWRRRALAPALVLGVAVAAAVPAGAEGEPDHAVGTVEQVQDAVPGQYLVTLAGADDGLDVAAEASDLVAEHDGEVLHVYEHVLDGFAAALSEEEAAALAGDPRVATVREDGRMQADELQQAAPWGLDRVDQRALPLNGEYSYNIGGDGVTVYVVDTGIRGSHQQFGGRVRAGYSAFPGASAANDCDGHGTHVAGIVGGSTYGVAKEVDLVAVRVLDCSGGGEVSDIIAGIDWATADGDHNGDGDARDPGEGGIVNVSIGGPRDADLEAAVAASIATGLTYAVSAGNSDTDACNQSPAVVPAAITVGSTTQGDARSSFSNYGYCVDLYAPGSSITSAYHRSDSDTYTESGTSQASPHVAGALARLRQGIPVDAPGLTITSVLMSTVTYGAVTGLPWGVNRLAYLEPPPIDVVLDLPTPDPVDFHFRLCDDEGVVCQTVTLDDDGTISPHQDRNSFAVLRPQTGTDTWVLSEVLAGEDWGLDAITCTNGEGVVDLEAAEVVLELDADDTTRCTFSYASTIPPPPTVSGTITEDGSGEPIEDAWVLGVNLDTGSILGATTDEAGDYELTTAAGDHLFQQFDPTLDHEPEWHDDQPLTGLADATVVPVPETGDTTIDADLAPTEATGAVAGVVTGDDGSPLAGAWVAVTDPTTAKIRGGRTDASGAYEVEGLPPGEYVVTFVDPTGDHEVEHFDDVDDPIDGTRVEVAAGQVVQADAELAADTGVDPSDVDFTLLGTVTRTNGASVPGAWVVAVGPGGFERGAVADAAGQYSMSLPWASYRIEFLDPSGVGVPEWWNDHPIDRYVDANVLTPGFGGLPPFPGAVYTINPSLVTAGGTITGFVTREGSFDTVDTTWVFLLDDGGRLVRTAVAAGEDGFAFYGLEPGDYYLAYVDPTGEHRFEYHDGASSIGDAATVTVVDGDSEFLNPHLAPT